MEVTLKSITPDSQIVIAEAARTCYDSFGNSSEESDEHLIKHLLNNGHHSVLEHASATFLIGGISRACSHQLVRHRLASFSQRSQRYVNEDGFDYVIPPSLRGDGTDWEFTRIMNRIQEGYKEFIKAGIKPEDARFVLPNACKTEIVMTANFREWRHVIEIRGLNKHAQWEIKEMAEKILRILSLHAPLIFADQIEKANL